MIRRSVAVLAAVGVLLVAALLAVLGRSGGEAGEGPLLFFENPPGGRRGGGLETETAGIPVLCYHYFRGPPGPARWARVTGTVLLNLPLLDDREEWTLPASSFEQHLRYLEDHGVRTLSLAELEAILLAGGDPPPRVVVLTIDDGERSLYEYAYPLLKKYGMKATLFAVTSRLGRGRWHGMEMCTWEEIEEMVRSGVLEVHSHTHDLHFKIRSSGGMWPAFAALADGEPVWRIRSNTMDAAASVEERASSAPASRQPENGPEALIEDLRLSRRVILEHLGTDTRFLAWPYGYGNGYVDSLAHEAGFSGVFTLRPGGNVSDDLTTGIRRYTVTAWTTFRSFESMVHSAVENRPGPKTARK
jgi:peptidoglycan/xylan/chitin deacetylase (PgdA/CDA1 family)